MTRSLLKQEAKNQLSKNFGVLILSGLILSIILGLPSVIPSHNARMIMSNPELFLKYYNLTEIFMNYFMWPPQVIIALISFFISPVLMLGVHHVHLKATTDEKPRLSEMFSKMPQFGTAFVTSLLTGIFVFLWSLLLIVPGIIATYSYSMVYFILAEHPEMSAMEAIRESKLIMKGHKWELFVLELSFFWWYLLCIVTFGLAMIYVMPYVEMAKANFYKNLVCKV